MDGRVPDVAFRAAPPQPLVSARSDSLQIQTLIALRVDLGRQPRVQRREGTFGGRDLPGAIWTPRPAHAVAYACLPLMPGDAAPPRSVLGIRSIPPRAPAARSFGDATRWPAPGHIARQMDRSAITRVPAQYGHRGLRSRPRGLARHAECPLAQPRRRTPFGRSREAIARVAARRSAPDPTRKPGQARRPRAIARASRDARRRMDTHGLRACATRPWQPSYVRRRIATTRARASPGEAPGMPRPRLPFAVEFREQRGVARCKRFLAGDRSRWARPLPRTRWTSTPESRPTGHRGRPHVPGRTPPPQLSMRRARDREHVQIDVELRI